MDKIAWILRQSNDVAFYSPDINAKVRCIPATILLIRIAQHERTGTLAATSKEILRQELHMTNREIDTAVNRLCRLNILSLTPTLTLNHEEINRIFSEGGQPL